MSISVFDIYSVGIGPSSSHTVGPMKATKMFLDELKTKNLLSKTNRVICELYGSLALTGKGHGTDKAIILGLFGHTPEDINPDHIQDILDRVHHDHQVSLLGERDIIFNPREDILFHRTETLPYHSNGMCFQAIDTDGNEIFKKILYSIGGGFIVDESTASSDDNFHGPSNVKVPLPYSSAEELLNIAKENNLSIAQVVFKNELAWRSEAEIREGLLKIWKVMQECVTRGCRNEGTLPGGLKVKRRAPSILKGLLSKPELSLTDPLTIMDWVNLYAIAVNEENAAGGQVVTAPTNGAAGIIPAVLHYYSRFTPKSNDDGIINFLLTAGAIGILYKTNASISGAEVGCQGEVGVACSMAAGGLTQALGGTNEQIENAAEIAMEHNLGLTCDPIGGLVQIPCIERNAMGSIKAINASRMALQGDGTHYVSLDKVIKTMKDTGADMESKYKETSRGGLAVNVTEC